VWTVAVALEAEDFGVVDEALDHGGAQRPRRAPEASAAGFLLRRAPAPVVPLGTSVNRSGLKRDSWRR
jgi:hypothetical protein